MLWKALRRMKRAQPTAHFTGDLGVCKGLGQMWAAWLDPPREVQGCLKATCPNRTPEPCILRNLCLVGLGRFLALFSRVTQPSVLWATLMSTSLSEDSSVP